jgi:hypothetical protein
MKFRYSLKILKTEETKDFPTLKKLAEHINIEYHQALSVIKSEDKMFLHPKIEELTKQYKIIKL